jgi:hypothetical protein
MTDYGPHWQLDDLGGGQFRQVFGLKQANYYEGGAWRPGSFDWRTGDGEFPHVVETAPIATYLSADGRLRICPTRDPRVYIEIALPQAKVGADFTEVSLGLASRAMNTLTRENANIGVDFIHGGHFVSFGEMTLKAGYRVPDDALLYPLAFSGCELKGDTLLVEGKPVGMLRAPLVLDKENAEDTRPIRWEQTEKGLLLTLPSLAGMTRPVIDPTLALQPDATAGEDSYIRPDNSNTNYGTNTLMEARVGPATKLTSLLKFTLTDIPTTATVNTSVSTLRTYTQAVLVGVYRGLSSWTEAGVTWNKYDGSNNWPGAAGGLAGTDYAASYETTFTCYAGAAPGATRDISIPIMTQVWVTTPANNKGMWLIAISTGSDGDRGDIYSSDYALDASYRPKLVVDYTLPAGVRIFSVPFGAPFSGVFA